MNNLLFVTVDLKDKSSKERVESDQGPRSPE